MMPQFKEKPAEFDQHLIFPSNIFDLLQDDYDCFVYNEIFKGLETSEIDKTIDDKKQISFADEDARIMKSKNGFDYNYNPQINVDSDNQIIVGEHVSQKANDK